MSRAGLRASLALRFILTTWSLSLHALLVQAPPGRAQYPTRGADARPGLSLIPPTAAAERLPHGAYARCVLRILRVGGRRAAHPGSRSDGEAHDLGDALAALAGEQPDALGDRASGRASPVRDVLDRHEGLGQIGADVVGRSGPSPEDDRRRLPKLSRPPGIPHGHRHGRGDADGARGARVGAPGPRSACAEDADAQGASSPGGRAAARPGLDGRGRGRGAVERRLHGRAGTSRCA